MVERGGVFRSWSGSVLRAQFPVALPAEEFRLPEITIYYYIKENNMELTPYLFWNIFITLVLAPILYGIRSNTAEAKRIDILLNKTREEIAKDYVTKQELKDDMNTLMDRVEKLHEKVDVEGNYGVSGGQKVISNMTSKVVKLEKSGR